MIPTKLLRAPAGARGRPSHTAQKACYSSPWHAALARPDAPGGGSPAAEGLPQYAVCPHKIKCAVLAGPPLGRRGGLPGQKHAVRGLLRGNSCQGSARPPTELQLSGTHSPTGQPKTRGSRIGLQSARPKSCARDATRLAYHLKVPAPRAAAQRWGRAELGSAPPDLLAQAQLGNARPQQRGARVGLLGQALQAQDVSAPSRDWLVAARCLHARLEHALETAPRLYQWARLPGQALASHAALRHKLSGAAASSRSPRPAGWQEGSCGAAAPGRGGQAVRQGAVRSCLRSLACCLLHACGVSGAASEGRKGQQSVVASEQPQRKLRACIDSSPSNDRRSGPLTWVRG